LQEHLTLAVGSAARKRISSRIVLSGFSGGTHSTYFRKNAFTCVSQKMAIPHGVFGYNMQV